MIIIDDTNTCPCGAYWQDNGYCTAGHPFVEPAQEPGRNRAWLGIMTLFDLAIIVAALLYIFAQL